jgi:hypothetical protein
LATA